MTLSQNEEVPCFSSSPWIIENLIRAGIYVACDEGIQSLISCYIINDTFAVVVFYAVIEASQRRFLQISTSRAAITQSFLMCNGLASLTTRSPPIEDNILAASVLWLAFLNSSAASSLRFPSRSWVAYYYKTLSIYIMLCLSASSTAKFHAFNNTAQSIARFTSPTFSKHLTALLANPMSQNLSPRSVNRGLLSGRSLANLSRLS